MFKEEFHTLQPIAYKLLKKELANQTMSHAYLFAGPQGTPKKEAAFLFAQSLVCPHKEEFACEECVVCQRIKNLQYADLIYLDGSETSIKKEEILNLQKQFSKTALETSNHKIYIMDHAENATVVALNSLLKFLEEPAGVTTTAILITNQVERILPTIRSRCQIVNFKPQSWEVCYKEGINQGLTSLDSYLLSNVVKNIHDSIEASTTEEYLKAKTLFQDFTKEALSNLDYALVLLQKEGFGNKNRVAEEKVFQYFMDFNLLFYRDVSLNKTFQEEWWTNYKQRYQSKGYPFPKIMEVLLEIKDSFNRSVNIPLLIDQMGYKLKEVLR